MTDRLFPCHSNAKSTQPERRQILPAATVVRPTQKRCVLAGPPRSADTLPLSAMLLCQDISDSRSVLTRRSGPFTFLMIQLDRRKRSQLGDIRYHLAEQFLHPAKLRKRHVVTFSGLVGCFLDVRFRDGRGPVMRDRNTLL
jgi:hypothetical protein